MRRARRHGKIGFSNSQLHGFWLFCEDSSKSGFFVRSERQKLVISRSNWSRTVKIVARGFTCVTIRDWWSIWESSSRFVDVSDFRVKLLEVRQDSWIWVSLTRSGCSDGSVEERRVVRVASSGSSRGVARCRSRRGCVPSREAARPARNVVRYLK